MGLTVHYEIKVEGGKENITSCIDYIKSQAKTLGFFCCGGWFVDYDSKFYNIDDDIPPQYDEMYKWGKLMYEVNSDHKEKSKFHREGYLLFCKWKSNNEPLVFGFVRNGKKGRKWRGSGSCKTQWSGGILSFHVAVCRLLKVCEEAGIIESVYDESNYYNSEMFDDTRFIDTSELNIMIVDKINKILQNKFEKEIEIYGGGSDSEEILEDYQLTI
jgi:hypothetical protein